jgi:PPP family 3-phenylpropionic acid transporter
LGIAFGLGGSVGAVLSGKIYGESLFLIESFIAFLAFVILYIHQKRKKAILHV